MKAAGYLERIGVGALVRRFGWLADHVKADVPSEARTRLHELAARSRKTWLGSDPTRALAGNQHQRERALWEKLSGIEAPH